VLGGLSVASFFTIAGTVAVANVDTVGTTQPVTPASSAASVSTPSAATQAPTQAAIPAAAPSATTKATPPTPAAQVPHTTTRGS